ncbi:MAG: hypothetical protein ACRDYU_00390 [Actinomycetes bacterium]
MARLRGLLGLPERREVSHADLGPEWPLTVESGEVWRYPDGAVLFVREGTRYAVNGAGKRVKGAVDLEPVWAEASEGLRRDVGPLLDLAERARPA